MMYDVIIIMACDCLFCLMLCSCLILPPSSGVMISSWRPAMTPEHSLVPLPEVVDDCYLSGEVVVCQQPPGTFSRVEWFIATLKAWFTCHVGDEHCSFARKQMRRQV